MKKPQHLENLHVITVAPEGPGSGDKLGHDASMTEKMGDENVSAMVKVSSPVAFPMLPIDRYGFLISDKYVHVVFAN